MPDLQRGLRRPRLALRRVLLLAAAVATTAAASAQAAVASASTPYPQSVSAPVAFPPTPTATGADTRLLDFDVFLGEREIGWQRFTLRRDGAATRVETQARFAVKLLGITAFAYDHRNVELWRDGCLQSIESRTDSNGTQYRVAGRAQGDAFVVDARAGELRLADCVGSFAYWDPRKLLGRERLLNPQTGEYVDVEVTPLGAGSVSLGDRRVEVARYALRGRDLDITVAYEQRSGEWVALETRVRGDQVLRYRRNAATLADAAPSAGRATG